MPVIVFVERLRVCVRRHMSVFVSVVTCCGDVIIQCPRYASNAMAFGLEAAIFVLPVQDIEVSLPRCIVCNAVFPMSICPSVRLSVCQTREL